MTEDCLMKWLCKGKLHALLLQIKRKTGKIYIAKDERIYRGDLKGTKS